MCSKSNKIHKKNEFKYPTMVAGSDHCAPRKDNIEEAAIDLNPHDTCSLCGNDYAGKKINSGICNECFNNSHVSAIFTILDSGSE